MPLKTVRQTVRLPASPAVIYSLLMGSRQHSVFTGGPAKISPKVGGAFSVFDGYAVGRNLDLIADEKIVQTWRAANWDEGDEPSVVTFSLKEEGRGTVLRFTQTGIPEKHAKSIAEGWNKYYWEPLRKLLAEGLKPVKKSAVKKAVKKTVKKAVERIAKKSAGKK